MIDGRTKEFNYLGRNSSSGTSYSAVQRWSATDTAWMTAYKVRYGFSTGLQTENNGQATDNTEGSVLSEYYDRVRYIDPNTYNNTYYNHADWYSDRYTDVKRVYDYGDGLQSDNLTPTKATYEVRFQNTADRDTGVENYRRAAHLDKVVLNAAFDENIGTASAKAFRLQNLYVPAYLAGLGADTEGLGQQGCSHHDDGTCIDYRYQAYVKKNDGTYVRYDGARKLDANHQYQLADGGEYDGKQIYLTEGNDAYTKEQEGGPDTDSTSHYFLAESCRTWDAGAGKFADGCNVQCVECGGGWFNATEFKFSYVGADFAVHTITATWKQLVEEGRVTGPWKIDPATAKIVYDAAGKPTHDPDGDYVIDVESYLRECEPVTAADGSVTYQSTATSGSGVGVSFPTYMCADTTNTNTIEGWANVIEVDRAHGTRHVHGRVPHLRGPQRLAPLPEHAAGFRPVADPCQRSAEGHRPGGRRGLQYHGELRLQVRRYLRRPPGGEPLVRHCRQQHAYRRQRVGRQLHERQRRPRQGAQQRR